MSIRHQPEWRLGAMKIADGEGTQAGDAPAEAAAAAPAAAAAAPAEAEAPKKPKVDPFYKPWDRFSRKPPPPKRSETASLDVDIEGHPGHHPNRSKVGTSSSENAIVSYQEAAETCKQKVAAIVAECKRLNIKYFDRNFKLASYDSLASMAPGENPSSVGDAGVRSIRRVQDIYKNPQFFKDGASANDVRQGQASDCWLLAAITAIIGTEGADHLPNLLRKLCVARDEKVGVYGFVFHRDGEWFSEVVDDSLCQKHGVDYQKQFICRIPQDKNLQDMEFKPFHFERLSDPAKEELSKGSDTLFFASCRDTDETWLPLLEKAYAKAHGDYQSVESGLAGEGVEDLTGGVNNSIDSDDILDLDKFWGELLQVNKEFLFGCSSRRGTDARPADDEGFIRSHAYTVLEAREYKKERLLKIRNPWGTVEWNGAWSDGSKEWTADAMSQLKHTFGDDGIFWISYKDYLRYYPRIDRTRLFGPEWHITQQWTSLIVDPIPQYHNTKFQLTVEKAGPIVIVLSQPDPRYFQGLEGRYRYTLHFRLYKDGEPTYLIRSSGESGLGRSTSGELEVEPGTYSVLVKVTAVRLDQYVTVAEVLRTWQKSRRDKLLAVGRQFDMTASKGLLREKEAENAHLLELEKRRAWVRVRAASLKADRLWAQEAKRKRVARKQRFNAGMNAKYQNKVAFRRQRKAQMQQQTQEEEEETKEDDEEEEKEEDDDEEEKEDADEKEEKEADDDGEKEDDDEEEEDDDEEESAPAPDNDAESAVSGPSEMEDDDFEWDGDMDDPTGPYFAEETGDDDDMYKDDQWQAICVVGLRLYSKDSSAKIEVLER